MRVLIVTGGSLPECAESRIRKFDPEWILCADAGMNHAAKLDLAVDRIMGDFDSADPAIMKHFESIERVTFPREKDYTDTELALETAMDQAGPEGEILIIGGTGTRMDHTMANIFLLKKAADRGISCTIADDHNEIRMIKGPIVQTVSGDIYPGQTYISLLPVFGDAKGVTLSGFFYPTQDITMKSGDSLGVSNELQVDRSEGTITLRSGYLLLLQTGDKKQI